MPELVTAVAPRARTFITDPEPAGPAKAQGLAGGTTAACPELSICIANWNCRQLLRDCLRSLLDQPQGVSLEILVVDNASTDGAADMVALEFPHIRLVRNETNEGFARASNQAAQWARGDYLLFLNNDTVVPSGALGKLLAYLEEHPEVVLLGPALRGADGALQKSFRRQPTVATFLHRTWLFRWTGLFRRRYRAYRRLATLGPAPLPVEVLMGAALLLRRTDFEHLQGWDNGYDFGGEDLDLCRRAAGLGRIVYLPEVEITHLGRVSTRDHIGFATPRIAAGFARHFRQSGATRPAVWFYKLAVTLDLPVQALVQFGQWLLRRLRGQKDKARKCWNDLRGTLAFLCTGLWRFWRS